MTMFLFRFLYCINKYNVFFDFEYPCSRLKFFHLIVNIHDVQKLLTGSVRYDILDSTALQSDAGRRENLSVKLQLSTIRDCFYNLEMRRVLQI